MDLCMKRFRSRDATIGLGGWTNQSVRVLSRGTTARLGDGSCRIALGVRGKLGCAIKWRNSGNRQNRRDEMPEEDSWDHSATGSAR